MNMKAFKITVSKLKKQMSYNQYLLKYKDKIDKLGEYVYSYETPYYEVRYEYEDLKISMYEKIKLDNKIETIKFMLNELHINMEKVEENLYRGSYFKVQFNQNGKLVIYSFNKRTSFEVTSAYDVYNACVHKEILH